jgi:hypothetical protein
VGYESSSGERRRLPVRAGRSSQWALIIWMRHEETACVCGPVITLLPGRSRSFPLSPPRPPRLSVGSIDWSTVSSQNQGEEWWMPWIDGALCRCRRAAGRPRSREWQHGMRSGGGCWETCGARRTVGCSAGQQVAAAHHGLLRGAAARCRHLPFVFGTSQPSRSLG